jgi:hypothetical protein
MEFASSSAILDENPLADVMGQPEERAAIRASALR